ncbi:MAG: metal ABC transporter substrate-binding protein [Lachnospiraceae bacterium]
MNNWKKRILLILALSMGVLITGCGAGNTSQKAFQDKDKLSIVTTIYPMYDFVNHIAGDKAEVINLVPAGTEPHDFELSTGDMQLIEEADVFIYNGAGMESFVEKTLKATSNKELIVVEAALKVDTLSSEGKTDPHTWLSVANAIEECEAIKDALVKIDGEHAEYYENNFNVYKEELEALDQRYREELSNLKKDTIVVAHEAFGYLCAEYGLKQEAVEGLTADSEPDSARMKELIDFCKEKDIKVIFFEELVSPKVAETIADEVGAKTMVLNPIEGLTAQQAEDGLDYISLMEENLEALKEALK